MAKRFTATEKWDDPWYRNLPLKYKCLWQYICDKCDNAGVWIKDWEMVEFCLKEKFDESEALKYFNFGKNRVETLNGTRWLIKDFVSFQFGKLSDNSRVHQSIINLIQKHEDKGYLKGIDTLPHRVKDKEKEKDIINNNNNIINNKNKINNININNNNKNKDIYDDYVLLTKEEYDSLKSKFGEAGLKARITRLANYIGAKGVKYKSHYRTILMWEGNSKYATITQLPTKPIIHKVETPKREEVSPEGLKEIHEMVKKVTGKE